MKCEEINKIYMDYISGNINSKTKQQIEDHLMECTGCKKMMGDVDFIWSKFVLATQEEPGPTLRIRFNSMLKTYIRVFDKTAVSTSWNEKINKWMGKLQSGRLVIQAGIAVIFLISGIFIGTMIEYKSRSNKEIVQMKQELQEMRKYMTLSLINRPSAVERLRGLTLSQFVNEPDEQLLSVLLKTLNSDPNINIRLAAIDALYLFSESKWIRAELVRSLSLQTSPLVQISLIDLLVDIREKSALEAMKNLINDHQSIEPVKQRARLGIKKII